MGEITHPARGYIGDKDALLRRLRRIEGQTRGLAKMVAEEEYCVDVLTQIAATRSALGAVAMILLADHMDHCLVRAARADGPEAERLVAEAVDAVRRLMRD